MSVAVGDILEGKVSGITNFGAFITLPGGVNGLVHISEVSHDYVGKVDEYLKRDQKVKVKVIAISNDGKVRLSIRQATPKTNKPVEVEWKSEDEKQKTMPFEDKINMFLKSSSERMDQFKTKDNKRHNRVRAKKNRD